MHWCAVKIFNKNINFDPNQNYNTMEAKFTNALNKHTKIDIQYN